MMIIRTKLPYEKNIFISVNCYLPSYNDSHQSIGVYKNPFQSWRKSYENIINLPP